MNRYDYDDDSSDEGWVPDAVRRVWWSSKMHYLSLACVVVFAVQGKGYQEAEAAARILSGVGFASLVASCGKEIEIGMALILANVVQGISFTAPQMVIGYSSAAAAPHIIYGSVLVQSLAVFGAVMYNSYGKQAVRCDAAGVYPSSTLLYASAVIATVPLIFPHSTSLCSVLLLLCFVALLFAPQALHYEYDFINDDADTGKHIPSLVTAWLACLGLMGYMLYPLPGLVSFTPALTTLVIPVLFTIPSAMLSSAFPEALSTSIKTSVTLLTLVLPLTSALPLSVPHAAVLCLNAITLKFVISSNIITFTEGVAAAFVYIAFIGGSLTN
eukprot:TRINITY_DN11229_c0_g2_i1.p1 TRINITY_DN11229_c0_g2~~TRINITY_DN11229_c0_g2_i1.p1  ORF type:complete len:328 (+),score=51.78 TRINITY_DN11229_c0_g2_i1:38-1021(+)